MPLKLEIITAERVVYSADDVREVVLPGVEGELAILPKHAPLMTMLRPGIMRVIHEDREEELAVHGGFLEVRDDRVTVLADAAERVEEIDIERAEAARRRAQELMAQRRRDEMEFSAAQAALQRALVRLKLVERVRRRGGR